MSRQQPIYVYSSEEELSEDEDEVAQNPEQPACQVISDDSSINTPVPPVVPTSGPAPIPFAESSRGPLLRAPLMRVGTTEPLPRMPRLAHLEWMTPTLERWRMLEGIPSTFETGESSRSPAPLPTTGEPIELTLPTLVAVTRTLFRISRGRDNIITELQSDVSRLDGDMIYLQDRYHGLFGNMVAAREIAESARVRVRVLERRTRTAGLVIGTCVLMAVLRTAIGFLLPYFY